jgi:hypothetical protein
MNRCETEGIGMGDFQWGPFLKQWSQAILASPDHESLGLPAEVIESSWLGLPGATDDQIKAAEARLGVDLPPSYRAFLKVTNGWRFTGGFAKRLLPVEEIDWLRVQYQEWIKVWMQPWDAIEWPGATTMPLEPGEPDYRHLTDTLAISEAGDGAIFLLNPKVMTPTGEWEAWFFADWVPGADSYASFWDMLQGQYQSQVGINTALARRVRPTDPPQAVIVKLPGLRNAIRQKMVDYRRAMEQNAQIGGEDYLQGIAEGLAAADSALGELQPVTDPQELRTGLHDLAVRLDADAQRLEIDLQHLSTEALANRLNPTQLLANLADSMARMTEGIYLGGKAHGLREGAGIIRWYLNEQ